MRKLIIAMTFGALLLPNQAFTLGLGDIEVNSALNQELNAEIALLSLAEGDEESLIVKLASREEFIRAGIEMPFMLSSIKFTTEKRNGVPYVKVVTPKPVREPFLNFLVEVDWPQGHLIREYTILLDPPIFTSKPAPKSSISSRPAKNETPAGVTKQPVMQDVGDFRPQASSTSGSDRVETRSTGTTLSDMDSVGSSGVPRVERLPVSADGYRIQKGDTAWSLAETLRPDPSVSVEKMMLALLRTNPEAFIRENVNGLKRGYILRVPELSAINAVNQAEALAMVREQNALWREYQQTMASGKPMPGYDDDMKSDGAMSTGMGDGRLAIVGVSDGSSSGVDPTAMTAEELRNELALTSERLETERLEKEALKNKVEALQGQVDNMKGLVSIEDREMAEMQSTVSTTEEAPELPVLDEVEEPVTEEPVVEKIAEVEEAEPEVLEKPARPQAAVPAPAAPMPKAEPGLLDDPMILMAGGALLLVLLALVALIIKRRRSASEDEDEDEDEEPYEEGETEAEEAADDVDKIIIDDDATQVADEEEAVEEVDHESTVILQAVPSEVPSHEETVITDAKTVITEAVKPVAPVEEESDDVMAEADVYLAYGIYQQAEELLRGAIKDNPDREMYRVKLCETFYAAKNAEGFEAAAKEMHAQSGGNESAGWLKVAALGKDLCPDSDIFKNVDVSAVADVAIVEPGAPGEMDIDLGGDENTSEAAELDFDIDAPEPVEESLELPDFDEPSEEVATAPEEAELEFDIDEAEAIDVPEEVEELEFDISEAEALDTPEESEDEFSLDIEASELDISDTESEEDKTTDEKSDDFVDSSLDFGIDEIDSAETTDESEDDGIDISMDLDADEFTDDSLDKAMGIDDTSDASTDDSIDFTTEDDGSIDLGFDMDDETSDESLDLGDDGKTMMHSTEDLDLSELDDIDEISTKLDLARAYMDMGDHEGSRSILDEVVADGNDDQKKEAEDLLKELDG